MTAESELDGGAVATDSDVTPDLGSRAPAFIQRSRSLHLAWRAGIFVAGLAVVVAGVILLPLPGPGWLIIFAGMAIWATEFGWARRVLHWTKTKFGDAARAARRRLRGDAKSRADK